jgi:GDP-L-fucose synthase
MDLILQNFCLIKTISFINVGYGSDLNIESLAKIIKEITGYSGITEFDKNKPDSTAKKLLNCDKISNLGWKAKVELKEGLIKSYNDYKKHF